ncbi:hypothetical protein ACQPZJ_25500 [Actinoplanes sp. CA-054009]
MSLARRASAELAGTALLVAAVIGSGVAATRLSPHDTGLRLLENTFAGIAPASVPGFIAAQLAGGVLALAAVAWWFPRRAPAGASPRQEMAPS